MFETTNQMRTHSTYVELRILKFVIVCHSLSAWLDILTGSCARRKPRIPIHHAVLWVISVCDFGHCCIFKTPLKSHWPQAAQLITTKSIQRLGTKDIPMQENSRILKWRYHIRPFFGWYIPLHRPEK